MGKLKNIINNDRGIKRIIQTLIVKKCLKVIPNGYDKPLIYENIINEKW